MYEYVAVTNIHENVAAVYHFIVALCCTSKKLAGKEVNLAILEAATSAQGEALSLAALRHPSTPQFSLPVDNANGYDVLVLLPCTTIGVTSCKSSEACFPSVTCEAIAVDPECPLHRNVRLKYRAMHPALNWHGVQPAIILQCRRPMITQKMLAFAF